MERDRLKEACVISVIRRRKRDKPRETGRDDCMGSNVRERGRSNEQQADIYDLYEIRTESDTERELKVYIKRYRERERRRERDQLQVHVTNVRQREGDPYIEQ